MWAKLLDLIVQYWKDKPRKDVLIHLLELRDWMRECQERYVAWRESPVEKEGHRRHYWLKSLQRAAQCAMEVEYVLALAEPKTFESLMDFFGSDVEEAGAT